MSVRISSVSVAPVHPPRWYAHAHNRAGYYRLASLVAARLPRRARNWLAGRAAGLVAPRFSAERAAVRRNLAQVRPDEDDAWLDGAVRRVFERFGVCFADLLSLNREPSAALWRHVEAPPEQGAMREALAGGRGCVSITAHLGNWELAGRLLGVLGRRVHVVMAPEADAGLAAVLPGPPAGPVRFVRLESPLVVVELIGALRRGEVVAFQMDRALGRRGDCRVPFFGRSAAFPLGPFAVAAAAGVPLVPAFCVLTAPGDYRLYEEPGITVKRGEELLGLRHAVSVLERYVSAHWDQWFNFFDVWQAADA